jgi:hypothetical protein
MEKRLTLKGTWSDPVWDREVLDRLGGGQPIERFMAPVVSGSCVVALLYGDNLPSRDPIGDTDGLEAFIRVAGAALAQTLPLQALPTRSSGTF